MTSEPYTVITAPSWTTTQARGSSSEEVRRLGHLDPGRRGAGRGRRGSTSTPTPGTFIVRRGARPIASERKPLAVEALRTLIVAEGVAHAISNTGARRLKQVDVTSALGSSPGD